MHLRNGESPVYTGLSLSQGAPLQDSSLPLPGDQHRQFVASFVSNVEHEQRPAHGWEVTFRHLPSALDLLRDLHLREVLPRILAASRPEMRNPRRKFQ
jgi:hypothetical protein